MLHLRVSLLMYVWHVDCKGCSFMLHFSPTEEQEEIRQLARSIAIEHMRTQARISEKNGNISPRSCRYLHRPA